LYNYFLAYLIISDLFFEKVFALIVVAGFPLPLVSYLTCIKIFLSRFKF